MLETNLCTAFKGLYKKLLTTAALAFALFTIFAVFNQADVIYAKADSVTILDSDSTEASDGCVFLGAYGTYYTDAQAALDRINEIRYEACVEGVPNPNNTSESLTLDDYVPLKWSSTLEKIARIRASEASFTMAHARLNSQSIFSVSYDSMTASCEDLAWDNVNVDTMVYAVNLWYDEKSDYIGVCDGSIVKTSSIQIGHYESLINPKYTYIGLGDFYNTSAPYSNTTAAAMSRTSKELDSTMLPGAEDVIQKIEVKESYIDNYYISGAKEVGLGKTKKLQAKASVTYGKYTSDLYCIEDISYTSSDTSVLTVDADGNVTGISYGTATVKAYSGDTELASSEITVNCANGCDLGDYDSNYQVSGTCDICGNSSTYTVPSTMLVYFKNSTTEGNTYSSAVPSSNPLGSYISCWLNYINGDEGYSDILVECSNPDILEVPERLTGMSFYHFQVKGIGTVKLTLTPEYNTKLKKSYTVKVGTDGSISITDTTINLEYTKTSYTGSAQTPSVSVTYKGLTINSDSNYSISYTNNTDAGTATVTIKGLGVFTDTVTKTFEIEQLSLGDNGSIILESDSLEYNAKAQTPGVTVKYNSSVLTADTDYTVEYKNNTDIGTATITVTGINNYSGSLTADFTISHTTHALGDATVYKAADCENSGESRRTCLYCDYYESTEISAIGHSYKDTVVAPTCTTKGYTTHVCSVCSDSYTDSYTELLAHSYKDTVVAPTCTSKGYTTHVCSVCSDSYTDSYTDLVDHTVVTDAAVAATCTTTGLTEGSHCSVCKTTLKAQEKVAATGHSYKDTVVASTCTSKGYTTHVCSVCSESYTDSYTELLAHSYKDTVVAPTCTTKGYTTHVCSVCSDSYTDSYTDLVDHTIVTDAAVRATCSSTGLTEGSHCSVCGKVFVAQEITYATPGTGHSYYITTVAPTCSEQGYNDYVCKYCGDSFKDQIVDKIAHTPVTDSAIAPTCDATGLTEGSHCSVCNTVIVAQEIISKSPHDYELISYEWSDDYHTCKASLKCKNYDTHSIELELTVDQETEEDAKCDEAGVVKFTATGNADGLDLSDTKTAQLDVIGHYYKGVVTAPTCTEKGYTTYTCLRCGDSYVAKYTDILEHTAVKDEAVESTCTGTGLTEGSHCSVCGKTLIAQELVPMLAHTAVKDEAVESTCTSFGLTEGSHCLVCNTVITAQKEIAKKAHTIVTDKAVAATCTTDGLTEGSHCSVCNYTFVYQTVIPATGHSYTTKKVAATTTSTGYTLYTCSVCGYSYKGNVTPKLSSGISLTKPSVTLANSTSGVKVTWSKVSGANGYIVYRKTPGGKFAVLKRITNSSTTTYTDTTAKAGTTYYYTVKAYSGSKYSSYETNQKIKYIKQPTVTLTNQSKGVKVTWTRTVGASGYYIYRKTANGKFVKIKTITSGSTVTFTDTTAKAGTTYYYTVKAYGKSGSKTYTSSYVANKTIKRLTQPSVTLTKVSNGIKITWSKITGASGYYVYRKTANGKFTKIKTITSGSTVYFTDKTAKSGTTYYYTVRAYSGNSLSSYVTNKSIKYKK
jgi:hypothetical protein